SLIKRQQAAPICTLFVQVCTRNACEVSTVIVNIPQLEVAFFEIIDREKTKNMGWQIVMRRHEFMRTGSHQSTKQ
ncbi:hypothetical protein, partial [Phyllobacterium endophyticum]|uniref:hypothetical protein n=1 Tax=Phyllobacterium endophyticum TaxID=1149773 RepID=UPI001AEEBD30